MRYDPSSHNFPGRFLCIVQFVIQTKIFIGSDEIFSRHHPQRRNQTYSSRYPAYHISGKKPPKRFRNIAKKLIIAVDRAEKYDKIVSGKASMVIDMTGPEPVTLRK